MNEGNQQIFLLWISALHLITATDGFSVRLGQTSVIKHVDESLELECKAQGCSSQVSFMWRGLLDQTVGGRVKTNKTTSRVIYDQLKITHQNIILCEGGCGGQKSQAKIKIQVYSFPTDPVISRVNDTTVKCMVQTVYSPEVLQVLWMLGDTILSDSDFTFDHEKGIQDVFSVYTPSKEVYGKNISCSATLKLSSKGDEKIRSVTAQYGPAFIKVSANTTVNIGERVELKCETDESSSITWKKLGKSEATLLSRTTMLVIEQANMSHTGKYECEAGNNLHSRRATMGVTVYAFPTDPVISRVNDTTVKCMVHSVYSPEVLQVLWMLGDTLLSDSQFTFDHEKGVQDIFSVYTPSKEVFGKNINCKASMRLSQVPENQRVRSVTAQYGPAFIKVSANTTVNIGERVELKCETDESSSITWKKLGKSEATLLSRTTMLVIEKANRSHVGMYECEASNDLSSRRATVGVTVYGPPNVPNIRLNQPTKPRAGDNVTISCDSDSVPLRELTFSGASLTQVEKQSSSLSINIPFIQLKDSGLYYCEAKNEFGSMRSSLNIAVQAPPRNSTVEVLPSVQVMETQNISVKCRTQSFPPASITLRREADGFDGFAKFSDGVFFLTDIRSEDKGMYTVNFTNELGYEVQTFELLVKERQTITPILTKTVVPSVSSFSLLTAAVVLVRYLRKAKKGKGDMNMGEVLDI
ncbi:vascular cell adhesion protein 1 [Hoplias malabaricus]|uniref:vascular cell adhesion protein 1 n=1 Tax=Hoplias malabaricus TaxID=27720 RepID=UPI0034633179